MEETPILGRMRPSRLPLGSVLLMAACTVLPVRSAAANEAETLRQQAIALEHGEGVARDPLEAAKRYCQSAFLGDALAQYNLGWMYANGRGVTRNDALAAFFFQAAAEQGLTGAQRMLQVVGPPSGDTPECMREPEPPATEATPVPPLPLSQVNYALIAPRKVFDLVMKLAPQFKVEPQLALAIIAAESNFDARAVSPRNAQGLMQLIPHTSDRFNVRNPYDPAQNIRGGLTYLRWLLAYFEGDLALVAAAYNAGEGTVERYRGVPPYQETRSYVKRILKSVGMLKRAAIFEPISLRYLNRKTFSQWQTKLRHKKQGAVTGPLFHLDP